MRVSLLAYHVMFYGALVVAGLALLWYRVRPRPDDVPSARVVNAGAGAAIRRALIAWGPLGGDSRTWVTWD